MKANNVKGVIFDIDGVILDSLSIWTDLGARYLKSKGKEPKEGLAETLFSMSMEQGAEYLADEYSLGLEPGEVFDGLCGMLRDYYYYEVQAKPGAAELIAGFRRSGIRITAATSSPREYVEKALAMFRRLFFFTWPGFLTRTAANLDIAENDVGLFFINQFQRLGAAFGGLYGIAFVAQDGKHAPLFALQNPEKAKLYKLPAINGVLLYGPPGCGKSLVLESFAEELGFNYSIIKGVEMGHIYQDGVLDNLQRVFDAAEIKAPFVLCFDEIEFIAPNPNGEGEDSNITQQISALFGMMNNCSKKGILVVATTNRPDLIDQAIMRVGCFDRVFFVPQPDFEARKDIFIDHLKERPCEELDFDELAKMSDDFNAGDITEAVNEAAMTAAYNDVPISQKILVDVLKYKNPTYSTKTRIGFNKN